MNSTWVAAGTNWTVAPTAWVAALVPLTPRVQPEMVETEAAV